MNSSPFETDIQDIIQMISDVETCLSSSKNKEGAAYLRDKEILLLSNGGVSEITNTTLITFKYTLFST